jgi:hypothetical protein
MVLRRDLKIDDHLEKIEKKARKIIWNIYGIRKSVNAKLNLNLFKMLIKPSYRLIVG